MFFLYVGFWTVNFWFLDEFQKKITWEQGEKVPVTHVGHASVLQFATVAGIFVWSQSFPEEQVTVLDLIPPAHDAEQFPHSLIIQVGQGVSLHCSLVLGFKAELQSDSTCVEHVTVRVKTPPPHSNQKTNSTIICRQSKCFALYWWIEILSVLRMEFLHAFLN